MVSGTLVTDSEAVLRYISQGATFRQIKLNNLIALKADQELIEKFGDDYKHHMQKVPRVNFLLGFIRLLQRR